MSDTPDDLVDATAAARLAQCHLSALHRWRMSGRVRAWKRVGRWYFSRREVEGLYRAQEAPAAGQASATDRQRRARAALERLRRRGYRVGTAAEMLGDGR